LFVAKTNAIYFLPRKRKDIFFDLRFIQNKKLSRGNLQSFDCTNKLKAKIHLSGEKSTINLGKYFSPWSKKTF
jgi:hypothetical protein